MPHPKATIQYRCDIHVVLVCAHDDGAVLVLGAEHHQGGHNVVVQLTILLAVRWGVEGTYYDLLEGCKLIFGLILLVSKECRFKGISSRS